MDLYFRHGGPLGVNAEPTNASAHSASLSLLFYDTALPALAAAVLLVLLLRRRLNRTAVLTAAVASFIVVLSLRRSVWLALPLIAAIVFLIGRGRFRTLARVVVPIVIPSESSTSPRQACPTNSTSTVTLSFTPPAGPAAPPRCPTWCSAPAAPPTPRRCSATSTPMSACPPTVSPDRGHAIVDTGSALVPQDGATQPAVVPSAYVGTDASLEPRSGEDIYLIARDPDLVIGPYVRDVSPVEGLPNHGAAGRPAVRSGVLHDPGGLGAEVRRPYLQRRRHAQPLSLTA